MNERTLPRKKKSKKSRLMLLLFILLNVLVIGYTAYSEFSGEHPSHVEFVFGAESMYCLILALLCPLAALATETVKYIIMMRSLHEKVSLRSAFQVVALGRYYDAVTPSGAGGQPFQIWYLNSNGYSSGVSAAMPLMQYMTMQFAFIITAVAVFIFNGGVLSDSPLKITAYIGTVCYSIVPVFIIIFVIAPKAARKLLKFFVRIAVCLHLVKDPFRTEVRIMRALSEYCVSTKNLAKDIPATVIMMIMSVLYHLAMFSIPYFVIRMFGGTLAYVTVVSVCAFIYAAISVVPTPGNSGAAEGSFYVLFSEVGAGNLFWAMLVWRFFCYYLFVVIGIAIYGYNSLKKQLLKR